MQHIFDPLSRNIGYDPEVMAAQRTLEATYLPTELDYGEGFSGGQNLSTDLGQEAWFTSGLFGLMLSKFADEDSQKEWFVQRNAIDYGHKELDRRIEAYRKVGETRDFTQKEADLIKEMISRRDLIEEDLEFVYENFGGDLDAIIDDKGKSFNDRWGVEGDEEAGLLDLLALFKDNPSYTGGVITAEVIKDLPFLGIAKLLGIAHKGLKLSTIVNNVSAKLAGIESKALRGLSQITTGVGSGMALGAGYEAAYTGLEQGDVKGDAVWAGAKFGGAFGVLGGLGLMYKGRPKEMGPPAPKGKLTPRYSIIPGADTVAKTKTRLAGATAGGGVASTEAVAGLGAGTLRKVSKAERASKASRLDAVEKIDLIRKAADEADDDRISAQAQESSILTDIQHDIEIIKGKREGTGPALVTTSDLEGRIKTQIDEFKLELEHRQLMKELDEAIKNNTPFRGIEPDKLNMRKDATIRNKDAYRFMRIAEEKAKEVERIKARFKGEQLTDRELNDRAFATALSELNRIDNDFVQPRKLDEAPILTPEEAEFESIRRQNVAKTPIEEEPLTPKEPGVMEAVGSTIRANPKTAMAAGGLAGYGLADTGENEFFGTVLGIAAMGLGPKVINSKSLKASAMKAKMAISKSIEGFANESKILEFQMQVVLKEVAEVFPTDADGLRLITAIETDSIKGLNKAEIEVRDKVKAMLDIIGKEAVLSGVIKSKGDVTQLKFHKFKKDKQGAFLQNYFPHIFNKDIDEDTLQELVAIYLKPSKSGIQRTMMETLEAIDNKYSDKNVITSPVRALELYTQAMTRTIYGKNLINSLFDLNLDTSGRKLPALMSEEVFKSLRKTDKENGGLTDQEALKYVGFDHPSLQGYVAHTDIKNLIDDQFATLRRGGMEDVKESILKLNNGLKRLFVFGSLFHAQALMLSAAYALGPSGIVKGFKGGKVSIKDADGNTIGTREASWSDLKIGSGEFNELAEEAIRQGLQIIAIKKQELVNPGFKAMEEALERLGPMGALGTKVFKNIDYLTWEYFHDRFKLAAYLQKKKRLIEKDGHTDEVAGRLASEFANDAFGSLDWNNFTTKLYTYASNNPDSLRGKTADALASVLPVNKRRWLNLGLFAPDWTVSNIRIVGKTFTTAKNYTEGFLKSMHRGDNAAWKSKEGKELASSFRMYAAYTGRAGVVTSGMWWAMTEAFSDEQPTMANLHDFWFGEQSGKLQLGGGESMVISKQIAEPIHWVQHPAHTFLNKGSIVPKTIMEGMFNKQWFSMKKGFPMGPAIVDPDGTYHYPKWILGKAVPIVTKPMFDTKLSWAEKLERTFTGFFGFPQYGEPGKYD